MRYDILLDGEFYGQGDLKYVNQLLTDYLMTCKVFGFEPVPHKIVLKEEQ